MVKRVVCSGAARYWWTFLTERPHPPPLACFDNAVSAYMAGKKISEPLVGDKRGIELTVYLGRGFPLSFLGRLQYLL